MAISVEKKSSVQTALISRVIVTRGEREKLLISSSVSSE